MSNQSPVKFLVVDDVAENVVALEALLRREGLEILCAQSGRQALELLLTEEISLAILDVQMPEMDGFELAELMRGTERTRHVPIIFVTGGAGDMGRMFRGYEAGAVDFLYKPVEPHLLRSKAEVFFQLSRQKRQLETAVQDLKETLRLNELFAAVLGHDLRNPLHSILSSAELMQKRTEDPATLKGLERIRSSGKRMTRMIDELLDFARVRLAGGIPLSPRPADLLEVSQRVIAEQRVSTPDVEIRLNAQGDARGRWDEDRLSQVISNLLGNAVRHGKEGGAIAVTLEGQANQVQLKVNNPGVIPMELRDKLFRPFLSSPERRGSNDGLGLGLYIVSQIVEAHGGSVGVESNELQGTTFRVCLPREKLFSEMGASA